MFRKLAGAAVTTVLVAAALGLALWFGFAAINNATLVIFRTGSMSPTMPPGAVAATVPVQATALKVGDVITVQRAGEKLPVTHRIVEIGAVPPPTPHSADTRAAMPGGPSPDPSSPDARQIIMQGDDNKTPDQFPYVITEARKVVFSAPHVGTVLTFMQSPIGTGLLIIGLGTIVTWAFWPRKDAILAEEPKHAAPPADAQQPRPEPRSVAPKHAAPDEELAEVRS